MVKEKTCAECSVRFSCGSGSDIPCWCNAFPAIMPMEEALGCYCPGCLKKVMQRKISGYIERLRKGEEDISKLRKYTDVNQEPVKDIDYYINEEGKYVFTEWYLLKRGYCCKNACRHCPYGFSKSEV